VLLGCGLRPGSERSRRLSCRPLAVLRCRPTAPSRKGRAVTRHPPPEAPRNAHPLVSRFADDFGKVAGYRRCSTHCRSSRACRVAQDNRCAPLQCLPRLSCRPSETCQLTFKRCQSLAAAEPFRHRKRQRSQRPLRNVSHLKRLANVRARISAQASR
jgi:hypothetical protein